MAAEHMWNTPLMPRLHWQMDENPKPLAVRNLTQDMISSYIVETKYFVGIFCALLDENNFFLMASTPHKGIESHF